MNGKKETNKVLKSYKRKLYFYIKQEMYLKNKMTIYISNRFSCDLVKIVRESSFSF